MSQENVEIVRRSFDAFNKRDTDTLREDWTADAEWSRAFLGGGLVEGAVFRGHQGLSEFLRLQAETWASIVADTVTVGDVPGDSVRAEARLEAVARRLVTFFAPYDAVLTPALARRPLAIGEVHGRGPEPWDHYQRSGHFTPYTAIVNVTGLPAVSLPLYQGADGLPLAVQLIGRPVGDPALLGLAAQLEQALPWAERRSQRAYASPRG